jgi:hypothetical protein
MYKKIDKKAVLDAQANKAQTRGRFQKRIILEES